MAKKKAGIEAAVPEPDDVGVDTSAPPPKPTPDIPTPTDPGWNDYVLGQLVDGETDQEGNPKVDGLRRLTEKLLGPIMRAIPNTVQAPSQDNGFHACVEFVINIAWGGDTSDMREFGDVADVYSGNTDPNFARHAAASASTKAEARAYRKALKLRKVSADEVTTVPVSESGLTGLITPTQVRTIENLCRSLDINLLAFINGGKGRYSNIEHVRYDSAREMLGHLNIYLQKPASIPTNFKKFDPDWKGNN